jgi:hypothetical protein
MLLKTRRIFRQNIRGQKNMKTIPSAFRLIIVPVLAVVIGGCTTAAPTIQAGPDAELSFDGLHKVDNSQADLAWARPDFDISGYTKIMPVGAGIEYRPVKNMGRTTMDRSKSGPYFIDDKARGQFETLVAEIFKEELQKSERFTMVDEAGPDVLMVRGGLLDVISYVPEEPVGGRSEIFLSSVGEATLVLELRDSETLTILARSVDRRAAETSGGSFQRSNSVTNSAEAKRLIRRWATRLREGLDGFAQ